MIRILRDINTNKRIHVFGNHTVHDKIQYGSQRIKVDKDDLGVAKSYILNNSISMHGAIVDTGVMPDDKQYTVELTITGDLAILDENGEATGNTSYRTETRRFVYDKRHGNAYYIDGELQAYTPEPLAPDETMKLTDTALIGYPDKVDYLSKEFLYWKAAKKIEDDSNN